MFEKEAEDKAFKKYPFPTNWGPIDLERNTKYEEGFKDGAEFGYNKAFVEADKNLKAIVTDFNKANEWHYVKDKDLPPLRKEVLWLVDKQLWLGELLESRIDFGEWELDSVLFNDYEIRWKEIVLPE